MNIELSVNLGDTVWFVVGRKKTIRVECDTAKIIHAETRESGTNVYVEKGDTGWPLLVGESAFLDEAAAQAEAARRREPLQKQRLSLDSFREHVRDQYGLLEGDSDALDDVFALAALGKRAEAVMRKVASVEMLDVIGVIGAESVQAAEAWVEDFDRMHGEAPDMGDHPDAD